MRSPASGLPSRRPECDFRLFLAGRKGMLAALVRASIRRYCMRRTLWILTCTLLYLGLQADAQGLGGRRGVDHGAWHGRLENFEADTNFVADQLGFAVAQALLFPIGAEIGV